MSRNRGFFFDQDGVIIDTERDGHRVAFNMAFREMGLPVQWDIPLYGELLQVAGGKERLLHYFHSTGFADAMEAPEIDHLIARLHARKTDIFITLLESGALPLRPGVRRLMEEINSEGLLLGVCTTSNERVARAVTTKILKGIRFDFVLAGDVVARKKPDPEIYNLALRRCGLDARQCIVVEDSHIGVAAAKAAGLFVVATPNDYTLKEDLGKADLVVSSLGDPGGEKGALLGGSVAFPYDGVLRMKQLVDLFSP